jgi:hypothetical protein
MMGLPDQTNIIDVAPYVIRLHLYDVANADLRLLFIWPPDEHTPFPDIRYLIQQLDDMATIGAKEGQ